MQVFTYKVRPLLPPKDDLRAALRAAHLKLREGDIIAISSKAVSIGEGRTLLASTISKENLVLREASWYQRTFRSKYGGKRTFTIAGGAMVSASGIDESNGNGHYILYPKDPKQSAKRLHDWFCKEHRIKTLGVIITDSTSIPLRRGAVGFALAWHGFAPLKDYRQTPDIFGRLFQFETANIADALATTANLAMGEGNEQTPVSVIRAAPRIVFTKTSKEPLGKELAVKPEDDLFAPLFFGKKWKSGKKKG